MPPTWPLTIPDMTSFVRFRTGYASSVGGLPSAYTFDMQVQEHAGQGFEIDAELRPLTTRAAREPWLTFLINLHGIAGTFLCPLQDTMIPRGAAAGDPGLPIIAGAGQTGDQVICKGGPVDVADYLLEGDMVQFSAGASARLHRVMQAADSVGASGDFTLVIWPSLRESPVDASAVVVANAMGRFRMAGNRVDHELDNALFAGLRFVAVEAITL